MKGVILAGGFGARLLPLTKLINKHLLPVYNRPMILYPLETLKNSGINEILIVSERSHIQKFMDFLGKGDDFGCSISYAGQEGASGIAAALNLAGDFVGSDNLAVILGDNIFGTDFEEEVSAFREGAKIFLKKVAEPRHFGVPIFAGGKITHIEEKPLEPKSPYAVTGFYLFDNKVFDAIARVKPSARGELEITDVVNIYLENGHLKHAFVENIWFDAGTFKSLLDAANWAAKKGEYLA